MITMVDKTNYDHKSSAVAILLLCSQTPKWKLLHGPLYGRKKQIKCLYKHSTMGSDSQRTQV